MTKVLNKFSFITEKGTVSVKVRALMKAQVVAKLKATFPDFVETEKGIAIPVGIDAMTGETIFAIVDPTLTVKTTVEHKEGAVKSKKAVDNPIVADIFAE